MLHSMIDTLTAWWQRSLERLWGEPAPVLGVHDGQFLPCPDTPNCVSSQSDKPKQHIAPLPYRKSPEEVMAAVMQVLQATPRQRIVRQEPRYIHAEFRSRIMRFPDDMEFYLDEDAQLLHFRAAARLGHSDLGVNRQRSEAIRATLEALL